MTLLLLVGFFTLGVKYLNLEEAFSPFVEKWQSWLEDGSAVLPTLGKGNRASGPAVAILYAHPGQCYGREDIHGPGEIVQVGEELARSLEERGIEVLQYSDNPASSYAEAKEQIGSLAQELRKQHPSLKLVLDLHRDAAPETVRHTYKLAVSEGGAERKLARLQFILPQGEKELVLLAGKLWSRAEEKYPGLLRGMVRTGTSEVLTVMVGDWQANTLSEAKASARLLAELLGDVLN
jgi:stage II sporulation protein P